MPDWAGDPLDVHDPRFWEPLHRLAEWGRAQRDATTLGDLLALSEQAGELPEEIATAWAEVAATPIAPPPPSMQQPRSARVDAALAHAFDAAAAAVARLEDRARHIFRARELGMPDDTSEPDREVQRVRQAKLGPTLEALGQRYGVTRERIRQIQAKAERRIRAALGREPAVRGAADAVRLALGVAFPLEALGEVLEFAAVVKPTGDAHLDELREVGWRTVLWYAGYQLTRDGWATRDATSPDALLDRLAARVRENGALADEEAREALAEMGVTPPAAEVLLREDPRGVKLFHDTYLPWGASLTDKAETVLDWLYEPATAEEILRHIGQDASLRGFAQRLIEDERFVRTGRSTFALSVWGMEEYSGISDEIAERIEQAGGSVLVNSLVEELTQKFGVAESSVRQYASAPRFVVENKRVRLRRPDEPVAPPAGVPEENSRVERTADGDLRYTIDVTDDTLRGSGKLMPSALAHALGVEPGRERTFVSPAGLEVRLTWPTQSAAGPSLGSVKSFAEALDAAIGDRLVLEFDSARGTVTAERLPPSDT